MHHHHHHGHHVGHREQRALNQEARQHNMANRALAHGNVAGFINHEIRANNAGARADNIHHNHHHHGHGGGFGRTTTVYTTPQVIVQPSYVQPQYAPVVQPQYIAPVVQPQYVQPQYVQPQYVQPQYPTAAAQPPAYAQPQYQQPLPPNWGQAVDPQGRTYYLDHNTQRTQYERPT